MTSREHRISTPDGRMLAVLEAGDPTGVAVLAHHGTPGCRLLFPPWVEDAESKGIRLLSYDRPGYGNSSPQPDRTVGDAARDVQTIAEALGIEKLTTWGISGGGPHALACAALLPDLVVAAASLASVAPYPAEGLDWMAGMGEDNVVEFGAALEGRPEITTLVEQYKDAFVGATPETIANELLTLLSPTDAAVLTGEVASFLLESMQVGIERRVDGWVDDDLAFTEPWGFDPTDIRIPVTLWQGLDDRFVPPAHGEWLAKRIPKADIHLSPDDGHLTLAARRIPDVHDWLLAHG
jgi:pimeloyl-ACP methyl ester carboxylesterase